MCLGSPRTSVVLRRAIVRIKLRDYYRGSSDSGERYRESDSEYGW
jgi:hypothetical protein